MPGISYTSASLLGTLLECVMYGIFIPLFIASCYVQWERISEGRGINYLMVSTTAFFGLSVTINLVLSLLRVVRAILNTTLRAPVYLSMGSPAEAMVRAAIFYAQATVADIIIVYRMYHIYDKKPYVCIIPCITIAGLFITGCGLVNQLRGSGPHRRSGEQWGAISFCLAIFNSLFMTAAIGLKLLRVHRQARNIRVGDSIVMRAMRVLTESAALWATFIVLNFCAAIVKSNLTHTFLLMSSPAVGISFSLISVRLGHMSPEPREESWDKSSLAQTSRKSTANRVAVSFPRVRVQRDVYVDDSKGFPMETLGSREQGCVGSSDDSVKVDCASLSPPTPV